MKYPFVTMRSDEIPFYKYVDRLNSLLSLRGQIKFPFVTVGTGVFPFFTVRTDEVPFCHWRS